MASTLIWDSAAELKRGAGVAARPRFGAKSGTRHAGWSARPKAVAPATAARTASIVRTGAFARHSRQRRAAVRRLAAMAGDILMVALWAAMVPGLMWLGTAAGF